MTSCEVTSNLASLLDGAIDRMAVLSTMPGNPKQDSPSTTVVTELDWVNSKKLKASLDSIESSTVQPDAGALTDAIKVAQQILRTTERVQKPGELTNETFGHIVVLTADAGNLCGEDLKHDTIQTHVLSTGIPQSQVWDKVECNGWKMCLLNPSLIRGWPTQPPRSQKSHHPRSLKDKLQALIQHARSGQLTDCLNDVMIEFETQVGCTKERVLGRTRFPRLQVGETKHVVVSLISEGHSIKLDHDEDSDDDLLKYLNIDEELMTDIGHILGDSRDRMLTVSMSYQHSAMPRNTYCTTSAKCLVQMRSQSSPYRQSVRDQKVSKGTTLLHQRLAEYYASYYTPRDAIATLWQEFGEEGCRSTCPVYISTLADELKYQARISERIAIENSPQKPRTISLGSPIGLRTAWSRQPSGKIENKPPVWNKDSDSEPHTPDGTKTTIVNELGMGDDARKIWTELSLMSEQSENRGNSRSLQERGEMIAEARLRGQKSAMDLPALRNLVARPQRISKSTILPSWF